MQLEQHLRARLADQVARGEVILVTGAGFSQAARGATAQAIPGVEQLKRILWECAFAGDPYDETSSLEELYECAVMQAGNQTQEALEAALRVDASSLPDIYATWLAMPWYRIYTLNVDDLVEVAARKFQLPREIVTVSALTDDLSEDGKLVCVHLNGRLADYPTMTFSGRQFGERTASPDLWYQQFVRDYAAHPVLFVGTTLDESPLWHHLAMRGRRRAERRELRPGSYLVSPSLSIPRSTILSGYNVDHIAMAQEEFASSVLATLDEEAQEGLRVLEARARGARGAEALLDVGELRRDTSGDPREFLLGREPAWCDLTEDGYAVERRFETRLAGDIAASGARVAVLTGTAGSGKSTTLMRMALEHHAAGRSVRWLNPDAALTLGRLRRAVRVEGADVLIIDDADDYGKSTGPLLAQLASENDSMLILAAIRGTRYRSLEIETHLRSTKHFQLTIPNLEDADIECLIDALTAANRLGVLAGKSRAEQIAAFKRRANRQLLVAMIETTTNERFDVKIQRECNEIGPDAGAVYAVIALATHFRRYVTVQEVLSAVDGRKLEALNLVRDLANQHLILQANGNELRLRHRVIADKVIEHYSAERVLADPVRGLLFALASSVTDAESRKSRKWRLVMRLFNHDWLISELREVSAIRRTYDEVESVMKWDAHYWLQRGSFEVEKGEIEKARTFLETARSLTPKDHKVQTEWAYMMLKRATRRANDSGALDQADEAFAALEDAIEERGSTDPYPFHVIGSQGLAWVRQAPLARDEKLKLLGRLRVLVDSGVKLHPNDDQLRQLAKDLEMHYLKLGVSDEEGPTARP
jgi:Mrp family chromosome partitioning ATPase